MKRYKLTDAIPKPTATGAGKRGGRQSQPRGSEPSDAAIELRNTQINQGLEGHRDRLVEIGRAQQTSGRITGNS